MHSLLDQARRIWGHFPVKKFENLHCSGFYLDLGGSYGAIEGSITLKQPYKGSGGVFPEKILIFPLSGINSGAFWTPKTN